ncbi:DUF2637 domain-containing protein [Planomonospora alba]|uniref:DUF2637 domain-containing protein n=1 Tax=Planomonospora alba TaxID=161354 RepID=UPI0031EC681A
MNPPVAAGPTPRPSASPPVPAEPGRVALALRHAGIALAGLGVAALTGAACVLSFETLRALALTGGARADLAYLYPAGFDALLAIALIGVLLLRGARWPIRLQAGAVLALLLLAAAAAEVARAAQTTLDVRQAAVAVAVAPWVMLTVALWLWLLLIKHARVRRAALDARPAGSGRDHDIVPFPETEPAPAERPAEHRERRPDPARHAPVEAALDPQAAPPLESVPVVPDPPVEPVVGPTPAPETPAVDEPIERGTRASGGADGPAGGRAPERGTAGGPGRREAPAAPEPAPTGPEPAPAMPAVSEAPAPGTAVPEAPTAQAPATPGSTASGSAAPAATAPEPVVVSEGVAPEHTSPVYVPKPAVPEPSPDRPVRWGDLVRPHPGDRLVHPPRPAVRETETAARAAADRDADTQPLPAQEDDSPDPAHGAEAADPREADAAAPPSGRMRSTPLPPEG